jgi:hypothetical protein
MRSPSTLIVAIFCLIVAAVAYPAKSAGKQPNGATCTTDAQCASGQCRPGPNAEPGYSQVSYCVGKNLSCAWPKAKGFEFGTFKKIADDYYLCARVRGFHAQFSALMPLLGRTSLAGGYQRNTFSTNSLVA